MAVVSMNYLLEAGAHFGHQTKRWNPKMAEYIFTSRDNIHIINLEKTTEMIEAAHAEISKIATNGGTFLFVGTKKQASECTKEEALRAKSYYVNERWLGGTLTNFRTIRNRVKRLIELEEMAASGHFDLLPKKEVIGLRKEQEKLNRLLSGIREMTKIPQALIIVDPKKEINAIKEARKLRIPVFGIVDTNCDPDDVDFIIPANDDAVRSIKVILGVLANAICQVNNLEVIDYVSEVPKEKEGSLTPENPVKAESVEQKPEVAPESVITTPEKVVERTIIEAPVVEAEAKPKTAEIEYSKMSLAELKSLAKEKGVKGYSGLKKMELVIALKNVK